MVDWTPEQEEAIEVDGNHILVAAAAGSGKTAVLVERIIQKIVRKNKPMNIDEIFVSTFTNAAAEEMRNRIGEALEQAIQAHSDSYHLKKQLSLLQRANISTLHSFCTKVIRQYAYLLDLDPGFRIADDMEMDMIRQEVLGEILENAYSGEGDSLEGFLQVVDMFSSDRSDDRIGQLILQLHQFSNENPWPETWLEEQSEVYHLTNETAEKDIYWLEMLKAQVEESLVGMEQMLQQAYDIATSVDGPEQYKQNLTDDLTLVQTALTKMTAWDEVQSFFNESSFKRLSGKKFECDENKKAQVKDLRDKVKKTWSDLKGTLFTRNLASHLEDLQVLHPAIKQLMDLTGQFREAYTKVKREKAIVDYADLEHFCLAILMDDCSTAEEIIPSPIAIQYRKQFKEVMVDEYQDINIVQEAILSCVSEQGEAGNMFMVGDVKQSIYRFRNAEPQLFIHKYEQYRHDSEKGIKIDLAKNFRSREAVLTGANYIFKQLMDVSLGDIGYDDDAALIYGNHNYDQYPAENKAVELLLVDQDQTGMEEEIESGETVEDLLKLQIEARTYTEQIKRWMGEGSHKRLQVMEKHGKSERPIQYRDIVILKRSMSGITTIIDEFKKQGIPVHAEMKTGYFAAIEIQVMINMLKIIDNPYQDIALASVLKSPIVGLNEEELAQMRLAQQHGSFYEALHEYRKEEADETPQLDTFLKMLHSFQQEAKEGALSELIWTIFTETGYYDYVGGIPGGRQRQANLRALYDRARNYESTSFRGLFRFLRFIERIEEEKKDLGEAPALSEQEDVVRIMTIHKSKGLEFPAVILGGMEKEFNSVRELNKQQYILDKDLGFATKFIDAEKRITYPTLFFSALKQHAKNQSLAEEIRVLYVAMTRAREKLVMVGVMKGLEKTIDKWCQIANHPEWVLPLHVRKGAKSFIDWVGPALIRHEDNASFLEDVQVSNQSVEQDLSKWCIHVVPATYYTNLGVEKAKEKAHLKEVIQQWDPAGIKITKENEAVASILSFNYKYEQAQVTRAKESVTEIKRRQEMADANSAQQFLSSFRAPLVKRPTFMQGKKKLSKAEIGTAMHAVMQHLPMNEPLTHSEVTSWLDKFVFEEKITEAEAEVIDVPKIVRFLETDIARTIFQSHQVQREVPFTYTLNTKEIYPDWGDAENEKILIQGVIDCLIETPDGLIILDYKTDYIAEENVDEATIQQLKARYETQIYLYKKALEDIMKQPVCQTYLYFFDQDITIPM